VLTLATGAFAGLFHVLSGPDHLAAVAPLAIEGRQRGWLAGWTWGMGHASGVVVVAVLAVLLRDALPPIDVLSAWSERLVGGALIAIGLWALRRSARIQPAPHTHGPLSHQHLLIQGGPGWARRLGHAHTAFYLGVLHGVAGSSHFFGVLPALALPTRGTAIAYIIAFGIGTVIAMTTFAAVIGSAGARWTHDRRLQRVMMTTAAVLAIAVGGVWLVGS
jgi:threonine/homoserine/homoserine lactone efflux protein